MKATCPRCWASGQDPEAARQPCALCAEAGPVCSPDPAHLRRELTAWIEQLLEGPPVYYRWGGDGALEDGVDCSGLVLYWARRLGLSPPRWTTAAMLGFDRIEEPEPGDLALYPGHVMVVLEGGRVAGMSGGRPGMSLPEAKTAGARLRAYSSYRYRPDFRRFARIPF